MRHKLLKLIPKKILYVAAGIAAGLIVFLVLMYGNWGLFTIFSHINQQPNPYHDDIVLFYTDDCSHCAKVTQFIKANAVEKKVTFVSLDMAEDTVNANILSDKAQTCGFDLKEIGVPFLWNGPAQTCVIGYPDIISFFQIAMKTKKP